MRPKIAFDATSRNSRIESHPEASEQSRPRFNWIGLPRRRDHLRVDISLPARVLIDVGAALDPFGNQWAPIRSYEAGDQHTVPGAQRVVRRLVYARKVDLYA